MTFDIEKELNVFDWLNSFQPDVAGLNPAQLSSVTQFSLIWSLFEAQICKNSASVNCFERKVGEWIGRNLLKHEDFEPFLNYFSSRYIANDEPNERFSKLRLRANDKPNLVLAVLKGEDHDIDKIVTVLLIIVYRYRNNLFHGLKWVYDLPRQVENFNVANRIMTKLLELNEQPREL